MKKTSKSSKKKGTSIKRSSEEWIYFSEKDITVKDIEKVFDSEESVEVWPEIGVAEVILSDKSSMDFEIADSSWGDEETDKIVEDNNIKTIFLVTFPTDAFKIAEKFMKDIIAVNGGFFCADNEELAPRVK